MQHPSVSSSNPSGLPIAQALADPYHSIAEVFEFADFPIMREMLWEFFKATITGTFPHSLTRAERENVVSLYEQLEKLIIVAHQIHETGKLE